jgi:pilus assembly protein Flp/PilA
MNKLNQMYNDLQSKLQSTLKDEKGATMIEYALMVALIAVVVVVAVGPLGLAAQGMFTGITASL